MPKGRPLINLDVPTTVSVRVLNITVRKKKAKSTIVTYLSGEISEPRNLRGQAVTIVYPTDIAEEAKETPEQ